MNSCEIIKRLKELADSDRLEGMARYGIDTDLAIGVSLPDIRKTAKYAGKDHILAQELWDTKIHEARMCASMVDIPSEVTEEQMELWVQDFNSWDICDQVCMNLFDKTALAYEKAFEWSKRDEEFVKRAGFVMMACLAVHDKKASNKKLEQFMPHIIEGATDQRNFVKKAVNWALRQIGKRNMSLNKAALVTARKIQKLASKSARWIAADTIRELESEKIVNMIKGKK